VVEPEHLPHKVIAGLAPKSDVENSLLPRGLSEKELLIEALARAKGNQSDAARLLGASRVTVWKRMKKHGISISKDLG
jgi:transcriptional regulator of acetoin/glycerol metabolism